MGFWGFGVFGFFDNSDFSSSAPTSNNANSANSANNASNAKNAKNDKIKLPKCGQKLIPLTVRESVNMENIQFGSWRELYMTDKCSKLLVNFISPNFPIFVGWFFVQNSDEGLYDNQVMYDKYKNSEIAKRISGKLNNANDLTFMPESTQFLSAKFANLSNQIKKTMIYNDMCLKMSNLSLCFVTEKVGRTFRDIPILVRNSLNIGTHFKDIFTNPTIFKKYLFELTYGLYCLNLRIGVLHGDCHLNNVTINDLFSGDFSNNTKSGNKLNDLYIVHDERFEIPVNGHQACVIDLSRAIIMNRKMLETDFGPSFTESFFKDQRARMYRIIEHFFKGFALKFKEKIKYVLLEKFDLIFKILSAVDIFMVARCMNIMLDNENKRGLEIHPDCIKFTNNLYEFTNNILTKGLQRIIDGNINHVSEIQWPNLTVLKVKFSEFKKTNTTSRENSIASVYCIDAPMKYSLKKYQNYSPLFRAENYKSAVKNFVSKDKSENLNKTLNTAYEKLENLTKCCPDETILLDNLLRQISDETILSDAQSGVFSSS